MTLGTRSAEKWIYMGKWAVPWGAILFLRLRKGSRRSDFSGDLFANNAVPVNNQARKIFEGRRKIINTISKIFNFCKNDYKSAVNSHVWAWSKFNIFANFGPLMANDSALESSYQGESVLGLLSGGRHNCKNKLFVQDKQTALDTYPSTF